MECKKADSRVPFALQVNVTDREAALSPQASDSLKAFAGNYVTYILPDKEGYPATKTRTLAISADSQGEDKSIGTRLAALNKFNLFLFSG